MASCSSQTSGRTIPHKSDSILLKRVDSPIPTSGRTSESCPDSDSAPSLSQMWSRRAVWLPCPRSSTALRSVSSLSPQSSASCPTPSWVSCIEFQTLFLLNYVLGCRFPVSSADFWLCLRKFCGEADKRRLAGQRREFKTYRKSTAQLT